MLRHIFFSLQLFDDEKSRATSQKGLLWLLEGLVRWNQLYLEEHPETPLLYQSGVRYSLPEQFERAKIPQVGIVRAALNRCKSAEAAQQALRELSEMCGGGEHFRDIPSIIENKGGDCDNVSSWRVAELRNYGIDARPYITWRKRDDGGVTYHALVLWPDGGTEDPSILLGMGGASKAIERAEERRKLAERRQNYLAGMIPSLSSEEELLGASPPMPPGFGPAIQYTIPFQTDDAYADWSPTRPQAYYANPLYQGGLIQQSGPIFNTLWRGARDDDDFDLDGDLGSRASDRLRRRAS